MAEGVANIQKSAIGLTEIKGQETLLAERCEAAYLNDLIEYKAMYIVNQLISSPDDVVRSVTTNLVSEKHVLSKVHSKYAKLETEQDLLVELVPRAIYEWKDAILECKLREVHQRIKEKGNSISNEEMRMLMTQSMELQQIKREFAKCLGERIVSPRK